MGGILVRAAVSTFQMAVSLNAFPGLVNCIFASVMLRPGPQVGAHAT